MKSNKFNKFSNLFTANIQTTVLSLFGSQLNTLITIPVYLQSRYSQCSKININTPTKRFLFHPPAKKHLYCLYIL